MPHLITSWLPWPFFPKDGSITAGASILTGRVEYNLEELEEMERLMDMLKGLAKEKKFIQSAWFWWDNFQKYLRDQGGHSTALTISSS